MNILSTTLILLLSWLAQAKFFQYDIPIKQFKQDRWFYLTKFGAHVGITKYKASFQVLGNDEYSQQKINSVYLLTFLDDDWDKLDLSQFCKNKGKAITNQHIQLGVSSNLEAQVVDGQFGQKERQHLWFFVLDDCANQIYSKFEDKDTKKIKLRVRIEILNSGESHFSSEESGIIYYVGIMSVVVTYLFFKNFRYAKRTFRQNEETDYGLVWLLVVIGIELVQDYFHLIHLVVYSLNGSGVVVLNLLSEILQAISRFLIQSLIILISWGWTINYLDLESFDIYLPLGLVIAYLEILAMALGKITDDSHYKYHQFDGWIGLVISFIEIGLYVYFEFGIRDTLRKANEGLKRFGNQLRAYSTVYFLCFPAFLVVSKLLPAYLRLKFILVGTSGSRVMSIILFLNAFTNKDSEYQGVSMLGKSPLDRIKRE